MRWNKVLFVSWCLEPSVDAECCQSEATHWSRQTDRTVTAKLAAQTNKKSISRSGKWKQAAYVLQLEGCHSLGDEDCSYGAAHGQESFVIASTIIGDVNMNQVDRCLKSPFWMQCLPCCDVVMEETLPVTCRIIIGEYLISDCSQATYPRVSSQHLSSPCWPGKSSHP